MGFVTYVMWNGEEWMARGIQVDKAVHDVDKCIPSICETQRSYKALPRDLETKTHDRNVLLVAFATHDICRTVPEKQAELLILINSPSID